MKLDNITLSVIQAGLQQVCDEMDLSFSRSAFSPVISIAGAVTSEHKGKDTFQEIDQHSLFEPITKKTFSIDQTQNIPETFDEAFSEARRMVGAGKTFRFNGKTYCTSTKDETKGLASVSWGQYRTGDTLNLQLDFINSSAIGTAEAVLTTGEKYIGQENTLGLLINNVEITSRAQRVTPSPENILEVYQFIARNVSTF